MRFTVEQYDQAIEALQEGKTQLKPDGHSCQICGDSGHQAFECGHNPLFAMAMCETVSRCFQDLHDTLHVLAGFESSMGEQTGPARVTLPKGD